MGNQKPEGGEFLYEGKVKKIYRLPSGECWQEFKDSCSAFNGQKRAEIPGKAAFNAKFTAEMMSFLETAGVRTHFLRWEAPQSLITKELQMIPIEVVVRNVVAGSLAKRLNAKEGQTLEPPVVEWFFKDDAQNDPQVSADLLVSFYKIPEADVERLRELALQINQLMGERFSRAGLKLVDFKLEFGRDKNGDILLGDEITPDTCRLWDAKTGEKLDKDRFRFDLGDLMEGYQKIERALKSSEGIQNKESR